MYVLINSQVLIGFDYSGGVPVYSREFGAARAAANRCNMKTITRKALRESINTIENKGLASAIGIRQSKASRKQIAFAEKVVLSGMNASEAYRASYNTKGKPNTVNCEASKLMKNPKVTSTIDHLERAKLQAASYSIESIKALAVSTLIDIATNSDKDAVKVQAVRSLGQIAGVDLFRETKRIETIKPSDDIKAQIMQQLKGMMLGTDDAQEVDANDLLSELTAADPTHAPPPESVDGTPADSIHTIPLEPSQSFLEDPPLPLDSSTPQGDIFSEDEDGYQDATGRVSTLKVKS